MTPLLTTRDRFEGWSCLDDVAAEAVHDDTAELHDAAYWDREAGRMERLVAFHEERNAWNKANYYRPFIARFHQAAARIRRQEGRP